MNTHFFDGKLEATRQSLDGVLSRIAPIKLEDKLKSIGMLRDKLGLSPLALHNYKIIEGDAVKPGGPNYYKDLEISAEDLLYLCTEIYEKLDEEDKATFRSLLSEQLTEMSTGMCPQGRIYRLLQIALVYDPCVSYT